MKKFLSLFLVVVLTLSLSITAFATPSEYTITINNTGVGETYCAYKILDATSDGTNIAYTIDSTNPNFAAISAFEGFDVTKVGSSTTYTVVNNGSKTDDEITEFIKGLPTAGLYYVSGVAAGNSITLDVEQPGYYYVTTTLGSVVMLDSTNKTATITEKNPEPTVEKEVDKASAFFTDTLTFTATLSEVANAKNLVFHDTMDSTLTMGTIVSVKLNGLTDIVATNYTIKNPATDGHTFDVSFDADYLATLNASDKIVITYTATINDTAVVNTDLENEAYVSFGDNGTSTKSTTETQVFELNIFKHNSSDTGLADAKFTLQRDDNKYAKFDATGKIIDWLDTVTDDCLITSPATGLIQIDGLKVGSYVLTEVEAPTGYNKITSPITVTINADGTTDGAASVTIGGDNYSVLKVLNNAGTVLPSTGGIGTTLFILGGSIAILLAGIFLVTNKRMKKEGYIA